MPRLVRATAVLSLLLFQTACTIKIEDKGSAGHAGSDADGGAGAAGKSAAGAGDNAAGKGGSGGSAGMAGNNTGAAGTGAGAGGASAQAGAEAPIQQTFVLHEITTLATGVPGAPSNGVISADGKVIAFVPNGNTPNKISVINFAGTGQREVDSYDSLVGSQAWVDISGDGTGLVSTDSVQLRYVKSDGSAKATIVSLSSNEISNIRISEDGTKLFYMLGRDSSDRMTSTPIERGIYVSKPDGSGKKLIVGAAAVAALYGATAEQVFRFDTCGHSLDVSADGSRVVFSINITNPSSAGNKVLGVGGDGSGLHKIAEGGGSAKSINKVGISADGSKVVYLASADNNVTELALSGFDGTDKRVIAKTPDVNFGDGCAQPVKLNTDGSRVYHADSGLMIDVKSGAITLLFAPAVSNGLPLIGDRMVGATMSNDGKRFVYQCGDADRHAQLVTLEIDPTDPGLAPKITKPRLSPAMLSKGGDATATLSARVEAGGSLVGVGAVGLRDGRRDQTLRGPLPLVDNGKNGDETADDRVFSNNGFGATSDAVSGPRSLRIQAENALEGHRHASVVEISTRVP